MSKVNERETLRETHPVAEKFQKFHSRPLSLSCRRSSSLASCGGRADPPTGLRPWESACSGAVSHGVSRQKTTAVQTAPSAYGQPVNSLYRQCFIAIQLPKAGRDSARQRGRTTVFQYLRCSDS